MMKELHIGVFRRTLALFLILILTGCATSNVKDGVILKPNQGLLAFKISSNTTTRMALGPFSWESTAGSRLADFNGISTAIVAKNGEDRYVVIALDPGEYMWRRIDANGGFALLDGKNRFKVLPNTITYIGDIRLYSFPGNRRFTIDSTSSISNMRAFLEANYPTYLSSMPMETTLAQFQIKP